MLKLLPILLSAVVNIANVNIFEIEGIFSSGHINALERYIEEVEQEENNLLIIQYNASDVNENSIIELKKILAKIDIPKAIWVGPNKTDIDISILKNFDYIGLSPGTTITTKEGFNALGEICKINSCDDEVASVTAEEGIYRDYLVVGSIGAFVENLGSQDISSILRTYITQF
jgi:hypothetical protein